MLCTDYEAITFNPRSRKGNDKTIHGLNFIVSDFNPRSRKGNDWLGCLLLWIEIILWESKELVFS